MDQIVENIEKHMVSTGLLAYSSAPFIITDIKNSHAPEWKKILAATIIDLDQYISRLTIGANQPTAHFSHFTFTHYPVEFDKNCTYFGHIQEAYDSAQNWTGVKNETVCAMRKFAEFITKLKTLGIYHQSLIVLKSDHGKPTQYYEEDDAMALKIRGNFRWGYGRYEPLLMVKGFVDSGGQLKENPEPVVLDDLAYTLCAESIKTSQCTQYPGFNILDDNLSIPDTAEVTLFVVKSKSSDYHYDSDTALQVKRQPSILFNLHKILDSEPAAEE